MVCQCKQKMCICQTAGWHKMMVGCEDLSAQLSAVFHTLSKASCELSAVEEPFSLPDNTFIHFILQLCFPALQSLFDECYFERDSLIGREFGSSERELALSQAL